MSVETTRPQRYPSWRATHWYCLLVAAFFLIRAGSTLAAGASFDRPGDGWRSILQLVFALVLLAGLAGPDLGGRGPARLAVAVTGLVYAGLSVLELFNGSVVLGVVPVDSRDRIVHPVLAIVAAACVAASRSRRAGQTASR